MKSVDTQIKNYTMVLRILLKINRGKLVTTEWKLKNQYIECHLADNNIVLYAIPLSGSKAIYRPLFMLTEAFSFLQRHKPDGSS